jgi:hypothetical protein
MTWRAIFARSYLPDLIHGAVPLSSLAAAAAAASPAAAAAAAAASLPAVTRGGGKERATTGLFASAAKQIMRSKGGTPAGADTRSHFSST